MASETNPDVDVPALVPARMVNEYVYCPRLFHLEWVQSEFRGNADTAEGQWRHRSVDQKKGKVAAPEIGGGVRRASSVMLGSEELGLVAVIDLLEADGDGVVPIDTKKGRAPLHGPAWDSDLVQLCVQGMLLREHGYRCTRGMIYFAETNERRVVEFDDQLIERTKAVIRGLKLVASSAFAPPPLIDSPKCPRCSLVSICLPDETNVMTDRIVAPPRRLIPSSTAAQPVYVTEQGTFVGMDGGRLRVSKKSEMVKEARLIDVSQVNLYGNIQISSQLIRECFRREVPILWFSYGGWFAGMAQGHPSKNVGLRLRQMTAPDDVALSAARAAVAGKIRNCRTLLMRNSRQRNETAMQSLRTLGAKALNADRFESLLGFEGAAARTYFGEFQTMLRGEMNFDFEGRNRRPPRDPVNCLLSFVYSLLVKDLTATLTGVGMDPYFGFYHKPRFGRPALALDLAEEFRPLIADSVVVGLINNGEVKSQDFIERAMGVALTDDGRRSVISAYERRLETEVTHPTFGYKVTYRRILQVQARIFAAFLMGEVPAYVAFTNR